MAPTAFDTFDQYAFGHYPGQVEDMGLQEIVTRLAIGSDIGYGLAVSDIDNRSASLVSDDYTNPTGITVRESVRDNNSDDTPVYPEDHEMSVMRVGRIWVTVADGATAGDPVYVDPDDGSIVSTAYGNTQFPNATFKTTAAAGELALVQLNGND